MTKKKSNTLYGVVLLAFGMICLLTSLILGVSVGEELKSSLPASGGKFGPITTTDTNEVVRIKVYQGVPNRRWSSINAKVVDSKGQFLFSFSEGLWFETGYDGGERWEEGKQRFDLPITFEEPGQYYIDFTTEYSPGYSGTYLYVDASPQIGSSIVHLWMGIISLIIGFFVIKSSSKSSRSY